MRLRSFVSERITRARARVRCVFYDVICDEPELNQLNGDSEKAEEARQPAMNACICIIFANE